MRRCVDLCVTPRLKDRRVRERKKRFVANEQAAFLCFLRIVALFGQRAGLHAGISHINKRARSANNVSG